MALAITTRSRRPARKKAGPSWMHARSAVRANTASPKFVSGSAPPYHCVRASTDPSPATQSGPRTGCSGFRAACLTTLGTPQRTCGTRQLLARDSRSVRIPLPLGNAARIVATKARNSIAVPKASSCSWWSLGASFLMTVHRTVGRSGWTRSTPLAQIGDGDGNGPTPRGIAELGQARGTCAWLIGSRSARSLMGFDSVQRRSGLRSVEAR
jgi:hypothetical protein